MKRRVGDTVVYEASCSSQCSKTRAFVVRRHFPTRQFNGGARNTMISPSLDFGQREVTRSYKGLLASLLLHQMVITDLACLGNETRDTPLRGRSWNTLKTQRNAASPIWVTTAYRQWAPRVHHSMISFDQCRLGQVVQKCTTLSTKE